MSSTVASTTWTRNTDAVCYSSRLRLLALASYELHDGTRHGAVHILDPDTLDETATAGSAGVLDLAWLDIAQTGGVAYLATACADAHLHVYSVDAKAAPAPIKPVASAACDGAGDACMSLSATAVQPGAAVLIALASTAGRLYTFMLAANGALEPSAAWDAHTLEGWAVAFDPSDANVLYSGGDDAALLRWDLRSGTVAGANRKSHRAGVCCIAPGGELRQHQIATGSYDEYIRLWDCRKLNQPLCEHQAGSGVWRLRWHTTEPHLLLAACMHDGFKVVRLADGALEEAVAYREHGVPDSLGYGVDWMDSDAATGGGRRHTVVSCSFYDRAVHTWEFHDDGVCSPALAESADAGRP